MGNLDAKAPNGESPLQVERRIRTAVDRIFSLDFSNALVVCHGRLLKVLLCSLLNVGLQNMHKFEQDNTAVNILESVDGKEFTSVVINCTEHLKDKS